MKSKVDPAFWRRFNGLPSPIQQLARSYSSFCGESILSFAPFQKFEKYRVRMLWDHYRATGYFLSSDTFVWIWIGTHEENNKH